MTQGRPEEVVFGLDNVPLEMPVAGIGTRALAVEHARNHAPRHADRSVLPIRGRHLKLTK